MKNICFRNFISNVWLSELEISGFGALITFASTGLSFLPMLLSGKYDTGYHLFFICNYSQKVSFYHNYSGKHTGNALIYV